jgi:hypothetical protein
MPAQLPSSLFSALGVYPDRVGANGACPGPVGMLILVFLRFLNLELTTDNLKLRLSPNSNHSRRSARLARKSNHSRTSAKTGGWGASCKMSSPITLLFSSTMLTMLSIEIVGAPTFPFLHAAKGKPKKRRPLRKAAATEAAERPARVHEKEREVAVSATLALLVCPFFRVCTYK